MYTTQNTFYHRHSAFPGTSPVADWAWRLNLPPPPFPRSLQLEKIGLSFSDLWLFLLTLLIEAYLNWSHECYFNNIAFTKNFIMQCPTANNQSTVQHLSLCIFHFRTTSQTSQKKRNIHSSILITYFLPLGHIIHCHHYLRCYSYENIC